MILPTEHTIYYRIHASHGQKTPNDRAEELQLLFICRKTIHIGVVIQVPAIAYTV